MTFYVDCDYCGKPIVGRYAKLTPTGWTAGRWPINDRDYHYHPPEFRGSEVGCYHEALQMLEHRRTSAFKLTDEDDTGLEWRLVPTRDSALAPEPVHSGEGTDIGWLILRYQTYAALRRAGFLTIEAIEQATDHELLSKPGIGWVTVRRVREAIERYRAEAAEKAAG